MFISKKEYTELVKSRDHWKDLAGKTLAQNEELLKTNEELIELSRQFNEENKALTAQLQSKQKENA